MAGIVGVVGGQVLGAQKETALTRLRHHPCFSQAWFFESPCVSLGAAYRPDSPPACFSNPDTGVAVIAYGMPLLKNRSWRVVRPEEIAESYDKCGADGLFRFDGSFVVVVWDSRAGKVLVVNDRMGSIPMQHAALPGRFAFAPEAKALFPLLGLQARLDAQGIIAFLAGGYPIGDGTLFERVHLLEPGHWIEVNTGDASASVRKHWDLRFSAGPRVSLREASEQLYELLLDSHQACVADAPARVQLLLTGGYDSRTILGALQAIGRPPEEAMTWGVTDGIAGSDPELARRLAGICGVPFRSLRYGAATVPEHAAEWSYVSELSSDNMGNYAAGAGFLFRDAIPAPVVLIGDQMLGPHGFARNLDDAAESVTRVPAGSLPLALEGLLRRDCRSDVVGSYHQQVQKIISGSLSDSPKDVQDYLFFHLYVSRWLLAPSYFREPMVSPRRPLLLNSVVDFTSALPPWLRVDKRVLLKMLHLKMPHLMNVPKNSADSLVDWGFELRGQAGLRGLAVDLLRFEWLRATPLAGTLDQGAFEALVARFFSQKPEPRSRGLYLVTKLFALRRSLSRTPALGRLSRCVEPIVKRALGVNEGDQAVQVILRLAQIALLQSCIERSWFDVSSGRPSFDEAA